MKNNKLIEFENSKHITKIADLGAIRGGTSTTTMTETGHHNPLPIGNTCTENETWSDGRDAGTVEVPCP